MKSQKSPKFRHPNYRKWLTKEQRRRPVKKRIKKRSVKRVIEVEKRIEDDVQDQDQVVVKVVEAHQTVAHQEVALDHDLVHLVRHQAHHQHQVQVVDQVDVLENEVNLVQEVRVQHQKLQLVRIPKKEQNQRNAFVVVQNVMARIKLKKGNTRPFKRTRTRS